MKLKASKKEIKNGYNKILKFGYCEIQALTRYLEPFAYSVGGYGWSCDYYDVKGICLSTGYQPIGQDTNHKIVKEYEDKAQKAIYNLPYQEAKDIVDGLIVELVEKLIKTK